MHFNTVSSSPVNLLGVNEGMNTLHNDQELNVYSNPSRQSAGIHFLLLLFIFQYSIKGVLFKHKYHPNRPMPDGNRQKQVSIIIYSYCHPL